MNTTIVKNVVISMGTFHTTMRAAYADTDQMGFVHHSNYVKYLEYARWECFRKKGLSYKKIEDEGIMMPVIDMELHFAKPIFYDETITIAVKMQLIKSTKLQIDYQLMNEAGQLINTAQTILAFVKKSTRHPCRVPDAIRELVEREFNLE